MKVSSPLCSTEAMLQIKHLLWASPDKQWTPENSLNGERVSIQGTTVIVRSLLKISRKGDVRFLINWSLLKWGIQ